MKKNKKNKQKKQKKQQKSIIIIGIGFILLLIISFGFLIRSAIQHNSVSDIDKMNRELNHYIEHKNIPSFGKGEVHVVVIADYRCPDCHRFRKEVYKPYLERYIDNNTIKYTEVEFPIVDDKSYDYSHMTDAINQLNDKELSKEFREIAYQKSKSDNNPEKTLKRTSINSKDFKQVMTFYDKHRNQAHIDRKELENLGINETPTIFINGERVAQDDVVKKIKQITK